MKILFFSDAQSIHTRRWAECFRERGHEVHVVSFRPQKIEGVTVHYLEEARFGKIGYLLSLFHLRRIWRELLPDVVHAQYVTSYGFIAALAGLRPLVVTAWGTDVLISPASSKISAAMVRFTLSKASMVTSVAEHMKESIIELGCSEEKYRTIPMGVDLDKFPFPLVRRSLGAPVYIISTRALEPVYDVGTVIRSIGCLKEKGIDIHLDLVGTGSQERELKRIVGEIALQDVVEFHGRVKFDELQRLLGRAHIFVSSSLSDGNNISLNEAMAKGCFPIATDIPANKQWIENGKNGYLFPVRCYDHLAEKIEASIARNDRDEVAIMNRRIVCERANWNRCVEEMEKLYHVIIYEKVRKA